MSKRVKVNLGARSYTITIGHALPVGTSIGNAKGVRALLVSDRHVDPLYGAACARRLAARGMRVARAVIPAGESSKSLSQLERLYDTAAGMRLDRSSVVVALGGGVVGDLAGFLAATYLRGVRLIQAPTSLLAMVDSSVGGKTGINLPQGKNLVGAFYQPVEVVADLDTLATLPDRQYRSGLAEVVKCGFIRDAGLLRLLETRADALLRRDPALIEEVVARCCRIKARVVGADEREDRLRAILNFGHTMGHAVENAAGYGRFLHGEAVAVGMAFALDVSVRHAGLAPRERDRGIALIRRLGLPVRAAGLPWKAVRAGMASDKKNRGGAPRFVLVEKPGSAIIGREVPEAELKRTYIEALCPT